MKNILIISFLAGLFFSCEQEVNNIPVPFQRKWVLETYLNPSDTASMIRVSLNTPSVGPILPVSVGIDAKISSGGVTVPLRLMNMLGIFYVPKRQMAIVPGRTYQIDIEAFGNIPKATATCTIPMALANTTIEMGEKIYTKYQGSDRYFVLRKGTLRFIDPNPAETNYYMVGQLTRYRNITKSSTGRDTVIVRENINYGTPTNDLLLKTNTFPSEFYLGESMTANEPIIVNPTQTTEYEMVLLHIDKTYYDFLMRSEKQDQNDGNPFSEPVLIKTNVQGGLGLMGAFTKTSVRVPLN